METEFLTMPQKGELIEQLGSGDAKAISFVIYEIDRLESVIKNYELAISQTSKAYYSTSFKKPKKFN